MVYIFSLNTAINPISVRLISSLFILIYPSCLYLLKRENLEVDFFPLFGVLKMKMRKSQIPSIPC